jgi:hypothetical protein
MAKLTDRALSAKRQFSKQPNAGKMHTIYMWSTERYKDETRRTKDGKIFPVLAKVGETKEYRAEVRIAQTDTTGVAETPVVLKQWHIPVQYRDKYLHAQLKKLGYPKNRDDKDREWIYFTDCKTSEEAMEIMDRLINKILTGKSAITNYLLFDYQRKIIDWAGERFKAGDRAILINAIMRAGKCLISHAIVKALGFKKVLIVTGKPGAIPSWTVLARGGEEEHVDYCDYIFHNYDDLKKSKIEFGTGECDLVAISLQFAAKHLETNTSDLLKQIVSTDWDLVIFDEQHFATNTEKTKKFWDNLTSKFWIELSGTPYKTLLSNRFPEESIYSFDYIDEQKIRDELLAVNDLDDEQTRQFRYKSRINWALISVPAKIRSLVNDENFNLGARGIFSTQGDQLVYRDAVNELINHVRLRGYKNLPPKFENIVEKVTKHTLWVLPKNVKAIKAVARMLQEHPYFKKYDIILATDKGNKDNIASVSDIGDVQTRIDAVESGKSDFIGTITLTCGRFLEGTSIKQWWAVHQINDAKSAEDYFQGSFRCKTPWSDGDKQEVIVFDYNPERFVSVMYQHIQRKADATGRDPEQVAAEFGECSDIYDYTDNGWNIVDGVDLKQRFLSNIGNYIERIGSFVKSACITDEIKQLMADKNKDSNSVSATTQLNENDLVRGSNQKKGKKNKPGGTTTQEEQDLTELRIRYALKQVYELSQIAQGDGLKIGSMYDVVNFKDPGLVVAITGLMPREWKTILPAIDVIGMDLALGQFNAI